MDEHSRERARRFDLIVGPHFDALYRAALRLTRCREDAEDLVQDVALRALPELGHLAEIESPRGWLLRVQYRLFIDRARRRARSPIIGTRDEGEQGQLACEAPGPEQLTDEYHRQRQLARVWHELSRKQRALLALHAEGYTLAELAEITGLSRNAIGVRLHRARARLARLVSHETRDELKLVRLEG